MKRRLIRRNKRHLSVWVRKPLVVIESPFGVVECEHDFHSLTLDQQIDYIINRHAGTLRALADR